MKEMLEKIEGYNFFIRQLQKLDSKMEAGHFIQAYREIHRIIAHLQKAKKAIIENNSGKDNVE